MKMLLNFVKTYFDENINMFEFWAVGQFDF